MRLPEDLREQWLDLARRLRDLPTDEFFDGEQYHPIRDELGELAWRVEPTDLDMASRIYALSPGLVPTVEWAEQVTDEEVQAMLLAIISQERWIRGMAKPSHANGFISYALERVAASDGAFDLRA